MRSPLCLEAKKLRLPRRKKLGLALGALLFVASILFPVPPSMAKVAPDNSLPAFAPQLALGMMLWIVVWWVTECISLGVTGLIAPPIYSPFLTSLTIREARRSRTLQP